MGLGRELPPRRNEWGHQGGRMVRIGQLTRSLAGELHRVAVCESWVGWDQQSEFVPALARLFRRRRSCRLLYARPDLQE